jgi:hypothetical protein
MKKIMMSKYGFVRWPEEDFSDDGSRFTCYRAGKAVRVSKLVSDGEVFLSIASYSVGKCTLPYEVYSTLPNYKKATWEYNGTSLAALTDEDLKDFYDACITYEKEYEEAEASIVYPSLEEIKTKANQLTSNALLELSKIENRFKRNMREAIEKFSTYEWRQFQEYFNNIVKDKQKYNIDTYPQTILGKKLSFTFVKPDFGTGESYWSKTINELFDKYNLD